MTDTIEIYIDHANATYLVGRCRYVAKRRGQSSVFEYVDEVGDYVVEQALVVGDDDERSFRAA